MHRSFTSTNACSVTASFWRPFAITVSPSIRGSEEASPLTVVEGSLITLMCESSGIPPPSLTWTKDGKRVSALIKRRDAAQEQKLYMRGWRAGTPHLFCFVYIPGSEVKSDQRVRILSGGRQLQISSAEKTDAASYTCTASSAAGTISKEYSLQVYGV